MIMFLKMQVREIIQTQKLEPRGLLQSITDILCLRISSLLKTFLWAVLTRFTLELLF